MPVLQLYQKPTEPESRSTVTGRGHGCWGKAQLLVMSYIYILTHTISF